SERDERVPGDEGVGLAKTGVRRDEVDARLGGMFGRGEASGIGELAAEIQAAHETEDVAERSALVRSKPGGQRERRLRRQRLFGALAGTICRRQQKNTTHGSPQLCGVRQNPQRTSIAPTVKPAPTEASRTRSPFFNRPLQTASSSARGIVAAV